MVCYGGFVSKNDFSDCEKLFLAPLLLIKIEKSSISTCLIIADQKFA